MSETNSKPWYQSLTIRALLVAVIAQALTFLDVGEKAATGYAAQAVDITLQGIEIVMMLLAAYGRKRATASLTLRKDKG